MLSVVTNLWVDYLTEIEALREGIGLQAFGQRDPLVEYKRRAYEMFQDLYARIRSQVVTYVFTYQYRGLAHLEDEARDRAAREAVEAPRSAKAAAPAQPAPAPKRAEAAPAPGKSLRSAAPTRAPVSAATGNKLGRNDPCWCGSGRKYKNCHMNSDLGQTAPVRAGGDGKNRR
jgi:preprotein translocase subunit SecA